MITTFRFAEQIADKGFYAEIEIELLNEPTVFNTHDLSYQQWEPGLCFGNSLFWESSPDIKKAYPRIKKLLTNAVDTTQTVVAYAMFTALAKELNPDILNRFAFDKLNASFCIHR